MLTLEQRIERLEKTSRRWRTACVATGCVAVAALMMGASEKPAAPDGNFAHLSAQDLTIQGENGAPALVVLSTKNQTSISISTANLSTSAVMVVGKDGANILMSNQTPKGLARASLGVDSQTGTIDARNVDGNTKEIEPD